MSGFTDESFAMLQSHAAVCPVPPDGKCAPCDAARTERRRRALAGCIVTGMDTDKRQTYYVCHDPHGANAPSHTHPIADLPPVRQPRTSFQRFRRPSR